MKRAPVCRYSFYKQRRALKTVYEHWRQVRCDCRPRNSDREVRTEMSNEIRAHALGGTASERLLKSSERDACGFHCAKRDYHKALSIIARRGKHNVHRVTILPNTYPRNASPICGLRLGDKFLHVAVRRDHDPLARIGSWSGAIAFRTCQPQGANQSRDSAEFVRRKKARQRR